MNLSEFSLNLLLASLLTLMTLSLLSSINFEANKLKQKIILEDTALKALITLAQNLDSSRLSYCAPNNAIINHTQELNPEGRYQWHNKILITYQQAQIAYLNTELSKEQNIINLPKTISISGTYLILDDCEHAILSKIINSEGQTLVLNHSLEIPLHPPIMIGSININRFEVKPKGLYRTTSEDEPALIYPNIQEIEINKDLIKVKAHTKNNDVQFQKHF